jgi:hypothetical protein
MTCPSRSKAARLARILTPPAGEDRLSRLPVGRVRDDGPVSERRNRGRPREEWLTEKINAADNQVDITATETADGDGP